MQPKIIPMNLVKVCPCCGRLGKVYQEAYPEYTSYRIVWDGPARGRDGMKQDVDGCVSFDNLISAEFVCGYSPPIPIAQKGKVK